MYNSDEERPGFVESDDGSQRISKNGQVLIEKTHMPSTSHPYAKIWKARCGDCGTTYGVNSCDYHIRRCPNCQGGEPGEPTELRDLEDRVGLKRRTDHRGGKVGDVFGQGDEEHGEGGSRAGGL